VDHHLFQPLEAARILTRDNETETIRVWHPLQLEAIQDAYDYNARYEWMENSLTKLREFAFPTNESLASNAKRAKALSVFGAHLIISHNREPILADILKRTLCIFRGLAQETPLAYMPDVALTANNLGTLLAALGEREAAKVLYDEALAIRRRLAGEYPKAYLPDVAGTVLNLALFHLHQKQNKDAAPFTTEAITLLAVCTPMAPPIYGPRLQNSLATARKLYRADSFQAERDAWLQALKTALAEKLASGNAEHLTRIITMTDEDFERLTGEAKDALWLPEELWKGGA
jgi:tetratricopeptide (TPR) repeat protein